MKKIFCCAIFILLIAHTLILYGCVDERSNSQDQDRDQATGSTVAEEQGTNIEGNSEIDSQSTGDTSETHDELGYDPEAVILSILESFGYDRSYITFTSRELVPDQMKDVWLISFDDGFGPMGAAYIADGADKPAYIKFVHPTGDLSPELVQPGDDLPGRIAGALGLDEDGYVRATWNTMPDYAEFRKYASLGEYQVSTHQVRMFFDHQTGGLLSVHFAGIDLDPVLNVVIDRDTAIATAVSSMGNSDVNVTHSELVQMVAPMLNNGDPLIYWDVTFSNNSSKLVNSVDGTIPNFMPGGI